ncbi:MAG: histidine kinase [Proteobacteria bacterium]|nr:histidine kinase [Pseudomonadota bacterium]
MTINRHAVQALVWGSWWLLSLALVRAFNQANSGLLFIMTVVAAGCWLASEGLRAWALRGHWLDLPPLQLVIRLLLAPLLLAALIQVAVALLTAAAATLGWIAPPPNARPSWGARTGYVMNTTFLLWLWLAAWGAGQFFTRWRQGEIARWQAEAAKRALELDVLRAQINPHFLFNALNNLRALIAEDPARAREMVTRLSAVLRHTLAHSASERVPLADEMAVVRDHLAIEQIHLEDRLRVDWQLGDGLDGAQVPPMVLQLLVENAIKHGIARTPGGGEIGIAIARESADPGGRLIIAVSNPGHWGQGEGGTGLGLAHLRERLARAGGTGADCQITENAGRVTVRLRLTP